jgi:IstB-like ATP binding protein/Multicopper oxidase
MRTITKASTFMPAASANPDGTPKDVDREFVTLFMIFDENMSPYLDANIQRFAGSPNAVRKKDGEFKESNKKHTINGLLFGNLNGLTMRRGERVRWYLIGLGNENDIHTAHWHGNTVLRRGSRTDTVKGYVPFTAIGSELLFEVFSQRYERGATLVTSNLPFDEWTSVFGSERLTGALLDRLTHHVRILEMNGDSYRLATAKKALRRTGNKQSANSNTKGDADTEI